MGITELIEDAKAEAERAAQAWIKENKPTIEATVRAMLDRRVQEVVAKLLGFGTRYGDGDEWKVDHCNGRSGESAVGDWLRERSGAAVHQWLTEQAGKLPDLPAKAVADLRAEYRDALKGELHRLVREKAVADARAELARVCAA